MGKCDDVCRMQLTDVYVIQSADKIRNERAPVRFCLGSIFLTPIVQLFGDYLLAAPTGAGTA